MREAVVRISIQGKDVTMALTPFLLSLDYTDKSDDELDDFKITLEDRAHLFQGAWLPKPGDKLSASIMTLNWHYLGEIAQLDCGEFECDEVELESSVGGGDVITIKGLPAVVKSSLMQQKKTRAWENVAMVSVIADIAGEAGLDTLYKAPDIIFVRVEQREEHDLEFLQRICKEQGLKLCLKKNVIIVYMGQTADSTEPIEIMRATANVESFHFKKTMNGIYTECRVGYSDPDDSEMKEGDFKPENAPGTGKVLTINQRVEDPAQAERLATAALRDKNSQEYTGDLSGMGDTRFIAGTVLKLTGWGDFDQKYVIKQATHHYDFGGGYTTKCDLEKALEY